MKKLLVVMIIMAVATLVVVGCTATKTYSYSTTGVCVEVVTADKDVQNACVTAGYSEGACPTENQLGTCVGYVEIEGQSFDATMYEAIGTAAAAEAACNLMGGTWNAN